MYRFVILLAAFPVLASAQGARFSWVRQIGGSGGQALAGIATDALGNTYAVGNTTSVDFPVVSALQAHPSASGVFRIDGPGANWKSLYQSGISAGGAVVLDPGDPRTVYVTASNEIHRSTDTGASWTLVSILPVIGVSGLAIDPSDSRILYAATIGQAVMKSVDGGATWSAINSGIPMDPQARPTALGIWIDPNHSAVLFAYAATGSVYSLVRSGDAGASWQVVMTDAVLGARAVSFDPATPGKVFASSDTGVAVSTDDGLTFAALGAVNDPYWQPMVILPDPKQAGVLYGGSQDALWKSTDAGKTWTKKLAEAAPMLALDTATGAIYAASGSQVLMTADGFDTTTAVGPPVLASINGMTAAGGHVFVTTAASTDIFIVKYDPQGNVLFATYFGGTSTDLARAIAVDGAGALYVTGTTQSVDFPVTAGAFAQSGGSFVFKLNADGTLAWSTYFAAQPNSIAVDGAGHAYIAGITGGAIPVTAGAYQTKFDGTFCGIGCLISIPPSNGFVTEFNAAGSGLVFSSYLGTQDETALAVGLFGDGSVLVAGRSMLYHLDATGSSLLGSKGVDGDLASLAADGAGNLLLAGGVSSAGPQFPTTPGAFQPAFYPVLSLPGTVANTSTGDAFVMRLDSHLNIMTSTLLGGESSDLAFSAIASADGSVLVGGSTYSQGFPTRGEIQGDFSSATGFLSQLTSDFSTLLFSTFTGDTRPFYVRSLAATPDGGIVVGGTTTTSAFPYSGGFVVYSSNGLFPDATFQTFVERVDLAQQKILRLDSVINAASQLAVPLSAGESFTVRGGGFGDDAVLLLNGSPVALVAHNGTSLTSAVPSGFTGASATLEVRSGGNSAAVVVPAAPASPGVFSQNGTGQGQGYILNQDGSLNSPANPAKEGDAITVFATGVGALTFDHGYAVTSSPVDVLVDGFYADGIAAVLGPVAGLPGEVYQISVFVPRPSDFASQNPNLKNFYMPPTVAVTLRVNGAVSQAGLALSVTH